MKKTKISKKSSNGIGLLALGGVAAYALTRPKTQPPGSGGDIKVTFTPVNPIVGAPDLKVGAFDTSSPVLEGQQTTMTVSIKNTSNQGGIPVAATLTVKIDIAIDKFLASQIVLLPVQTLTYSYAANETKTYTYTVTVPLGTGGKSVGGFAFLYDPNGIGIASGAGTQPITSVTISAQIEIAYLATWSGVEGEPYSVWTGIMGGSPTITIPFGKNVILAFSWKNNSDIPIVGHGYIQVIKPIPPGSPGPAEQFTNHGFGGQDQNVNPAASQAIEFYQKSGTTVTVPTFIANQPGNYHVAQYLRKDNASGQPLGGWAYDIIVGQPEIVYAGTITIS